MSHAEAPPAADHADTFSVLPTERPSQWPIKEGLAPEGDEKDFDWADLVPLYVHPVKIAIIEALLWFGEPLSANELARLFNHPGYKLPTVAYHANELTSKGALEHVYERRVRGARETYYFFPERSRD
jgi:Helix-turn-helix domain